MNNNTNSDGYKWILVLINKKHRGDKNKHSLHLLGIDMILSTDW